MGARRFEDMEEEVWGAKKDEATGAAERLRLEREGLVEFMSLSIREHSLEQ